jgi:hypothetical protein
VIPIHRQPASNIPENAMFDKQASRIRVRSEHCMGTLKGRFQCLQGLRVNIHNNYDHKKACQWVSIAIILHNLVIDVEGSESAAEFIPSHTSADEFDDAGHDVFGQENLNVGGEQIGEEKRYQLTVELLAFKHGMYV